MAYQIVWTAEADNDFHSIINYLKQNWSEHSAEENYLVLLSIYPYKRDITKSKYY